MNPRGPSLARRLSLMVLTDPRSAAGPLPRVVEACLRGGASAVQLRHKDADAATLLAEARELAPLVRGQGGLFLVNDRLDVALAAGADGVHLGPEDVPVSAARGVVPDDFVIGHSTDDPEAAAAAAGAGADYLGVGSVYGTSSKPGLEGEAIGPERVGQVLRAAGLPGVGIGGVTPENAGAVAATGAGVAVLSAVMDAPDPEAVCRELRRAVDRARRGEGSGESTPGER